MSVQPQTLQQRILALEAERALLSASLVKADATQDALVEALQHLDIITRRSGIVSDAEVAELEQRYGADLTWGELADAVHGAVHAALLKARTR